MGQANARELRNVRLDRERAEKVEIRTWALAIMAAFLYPTQGDESIETASFLLDDARKRAEKDIPEVE